MIEYGSTVTTHAANIIKICRRHKQMHGYLECQYRQKISLKTFQKFLEKLKYISKNFKIYSICTQHYDNQRSLQMQCYLNISIIDSKIQVWNQQFANSTWVITGAHATSLLKTWLKHSLLPHSSGTTLHKNATISPTTTTKNINKQESHAVEMKPCNAAAVLFGLKFADDIHYKFKNSQTSKAELQSSKHTGTKQNLTQNGDSMSFKVTCFGVMESVMSAVFRW